MRDVAGVGFNVGVVDRAVGGALHILGAALDFVLRCDMSAVGCEFLMWKEEKRFVSSLPALVLCCHVLGSTSRYECVWFVL